MLTTEEKIEYCTTTILSIANMCMNTPITLRPALAHVLESAINDLNQYLDIIRDHAFVYNYYKKILIFKNELVARNYCPGFIDITILSDAQILESLNN